MLIIHISLNSLSWTGLSISILGWPQISLYDIIKIVERNVTGFKDDTINIQENHEPHSKEVLAYTSLPL
jgi:hypothetical protein